MTKAVKILEKDGFIKRSRDPVDNRNYILQTTEKGSSAGRQTAAKFDRLQALIFSEFSIEELEELTVLLERLKARVSDLSGKD